VILTFLTSWPIETAVGNNFQFQGKDWKKIPICYIAMFLKHILWKFCYFSLRVRYYKLVLLTVKRLKIQKRLFQRSGKTLFSWTVSTLVKISNCLIATAVKLVTDLKGWWFALCIYLHCFTILLDCCTKMIHCNLSLFFIETGS